MAYYGQVSLLPNQTHINKDSYFFLLANVSTLTANNISTGSITTGSISSLTGYINDLETSGISTSQLDLDGQTLTATGTELLLNGIPLATTSNLSSIGDWALEAAISTVNLNGNNIINGTLSAISSISTVNIQATNILAQNIVALNILSLSSYTSTISSVITMTDALVLSSLNGYNISSIVNPTPNTSSLTASTIEAYQINADNLSIASIYVSSINGNEFTSTGIVASQAFVSSLAANSISSLGAELRSVFTSSIQFNAGGIKPTFNFDTGSLVNGLQSGLTNIGIGVGAGVGLIGTGMIASAFSRTANNSITNNLYEQYAVPTQLQFSTLGESISTYFRYVSSSSGEGNSVPGQELIISTIIPAGTLAIRSLGDPINLVDPSTYTSSIQSFGQWVEVPQQVLPSSISSLNEWAFYPALSTISFAMGIPAIVESSPGNNIGIKGQNIQLIGDYTDAKNLLLVSTISTATIQGANNNILGVGLQGLEIDAENLFLSSPNVSHPGTFNGSTILANSEVVKQSGVSSLTASTIICSLLSTSLYYANYYQVSSLNIGTLANISTTDTALLKSDVASISSLTVSSLTGIPFNVNEWADYPAISSIRFATGIDAVVESANTSTDPILIIGSDVQLLGSHVDADNLLLVSSISTGTILGANNNLFGVGVQGLQIEAENLFLSSPNITNTGTFNGNQIISIYSRSVAASISSLTASTVNGKVVSLQDDANSFSSITTSTLFSPYIITDQLFISTQISGDIVGSAPTQSIISSFSSIQANGGLFSNLNVGFISSSKITTSSITLNSGVYSSIIVPQATTNPGVGTSTMTTINTDLNLGNNDLYCQQVRLGKGQLDNYAEVFLYGNDGSYRTVASGSADRTVRVASSVAPLGPGYVLDTALNPPFFSTINQSTALMAYFPSSLANTIGISTISFQPPKVVAGGFSSASTQNLVINTPLVLWNEITDVSVGITTSTNAIVIPSVGNYELNISIQFSKTGGAGTADFWARLNGSDIPNSASQIYLPAGGLGQALGNVSFIGHYNAGDKIQIVCATPDVGVSATFFQSTVTTPYTRPAVPSLITTVKCLNY